MPPKKKYARIHHSQFGGAAKCSAGGIGLLIHPLRAEREHTGDEAEDRGDEAARVPREVVAAGQRGVLRARQLVDLGPVQEQEERVVLGAHDRVRGTHLEAARVLTVLADVAHHQPRLSACDRRGCHDDTVVVGDVLDEFDVTPVLGIELPGVVEAVEKQLGLVALELVPFLARDLTGLATDADRRVGEEPHGTLLERCHQNPIRFGVTFVKPRSAATMSSGMATISSTMGTAWLSRRASTLTM